MMRYTSLWKLPTASRCGWVSNTQNQGTRNDDSGIGNLRHESRDSRIADDHIPAIDTCATADMNINLGALVEPTHVQVSPLSEGEVRGSQEDAAQSAIGNLRWICYPRMLAGEFPSASGRPANTTTPGAEGGKLA